MKIISSTPQVQASKTVVAKKLPKHTTESDMIEFFKPAGEIVDVRYEDGDYGWCRTCYVEFATEEAAKKALELNGQRLKSKYIVIVPPGESTGATKTLVVKNLSFSAAESDVIEFFEKAGDIVDVRFSSGAFRGNFHIEFATEGAAQEAMLLNGKYLMGRPVKLGFACETISFRGLDTSSGLDQIRSSLKEHFSNCEKILWMHIQTDDYTGAPMGNAIIEFVDPQAFPKAPAMNGHKLVDKPLTIEDLVPNYLDSHGTGGRRILGGRSPGHYGGSIFPFRYLLYSDRGWRGAGIGKLEASTIFLQERKLNLMTISLKGEKQGGAGG